MAALSGTNAGNRSRIWSWLLTQADPTGDVLEAPDYPEKAVQISGTFGGATCVLQGSNDAVTWFTLTDGQGNPISATSALLEVVQENPRYMRGNVTSGASGTTSIAVSIIGTGVRI